ncbi:hypothetical protein MPL1032_180158 [Mesorhizobium plurifarium]|uniref:Uncharacterized protein n=1 Tax=Mesorhizobium plurifarium TaxID=69974 RepID=A0A0K2VTM2_MESPL|nr:hypothetical protein MPL1032_180158 [Mesorhizobium plurifarium]
MMRIQPTGPSEGRQVLGLDQNRVNSHIPICLPISGGLFHGGVRPGLIDCPFLNCREGQVGTESPDHPAPFSLLGGVYEGFSHSRAGFDGYVRGGAHHSRLS